MDLTTQYLGMRLPHPLVPSAPQPLSKDDTAKKRHCDAVWMASHGRRGMAAVLLGSETQKVLAHTTVPVIVFR